MGISFFAGELRCPYCPMTCATTHWPSNGDHIPFFIQKEPGNHSLTIHCPDCGKDWYVVWDGNPGPTELVIFVKR